MKVALKITVFHLYDEPPKQFFMITQAQNNSPLEPLKAKTNTKIRHHQISKLKKALKIKVVALYECSKNNFYYLKANLIP